jgi:peptidoglycan/LPS O-acetylase OafA/YrhL
MGATRLLRRSGRSAEAGRPPREHRDDIQGLRAVAVLLVALSHAGVSFMRGGYVGVDVFFVLSGFLITGLLLKGAEKEGTVSVTDFYVRRARRILPAATLTLVATNLVTYSLLNFVRAKQFLHDSLSAAVFTTNFHFANQGTDYFARAQPPSPVQHFWSLAVEEQFYIVWPGLLGLVLFGFGLKHLSRSRAKEVTPRKVARLLLVVVLVGAASLALSIVDTRAHPTSAYFSTFDRAWELALGAALAVAATRLENLRGWIRVALGWIGLAMIVVAAVKYSSATPFPGSAALLPTVGAALVIAAGLGSRTRLGVGRILSIAPMRYVGDRSYTFYLWHWPALTIAALYAGRHLSVQKNLLLLGGAFLLSIVTYRLFENPLRRMTWRPPRAALVLWPASILAVLFAAYWGLHRIDVKETSDAAAGTPLYPGLASGYFNADGSTKSTRIAQAPVPTPQGTPRAVADAVRATQHGAGIPSGLHPAVGSLLNDHQDLPPGCIAADDASSSPVCRMGDTSAKRTLAVMGDSHAEMWLPAIDAMAKRDGWVVLPVVKSACTPADWWISRYGTPQCHRWFPWAKKQIKSLHPDVTLLAGNFWSLGTEHAATIGGMSSLAQDLTRSSKKVVVLADTPQQDEQPVDCLLAGNASMARCSVTPSADQLAPNDDIASVVSGPKLNLMDPTPWFCAEGVCPMVIGRTIAYFDTNHVSRTYALELSGVFRAAFRQAAGLDSQKRSSSGKSA